MHYTENELFHWRVLRIKKSVTENFIFCSMLDDITILSKGKDDAHAILIEKHGWCQSHYFPETRF